jgi:hypothetical protein
LSLVAAVLTLDRNLLAAQSENRGSRGGGDEKHHSEEGSRTYQQLAQQPRAGAAREQQPRAGSREPHAGSRSRAQQQPCAGSKGSRTQGASSSRRAQGESARRGGGSGDGEETYQRAAASTPAVARPEQGAAASARRERESARREQRDLPRAGQPHAGQRACAKKFAAHMKEDLPRAHREAQNAPKAQCKP